MHKRMTAILLLGGEGVRFGGKTPKQFQLLAGKKIYLHTLERFLGLDAFEEILLVTHHGHRDEVEKDLLTYPESRVRVVSAGATRQASSYQGLMHCSAGTEYVVIHEAVRPFVTKKMILDNVMMVSQHEAVNTCAPSFDAIVESADGKQIDRIPPRSRCLRGQTPQSFKYDLIVQAHRKAIENGVSDSPDDCRLVLEMEHPVYIVPGDEQNIKITTELDLFVAERLIR